MTDGPASPATDSGAGIGLPALDSLDPEDSEACIRELDGALNDLTRRFDALGHAGRSDHDSRGAEAHDDAVSREGGRRGGRR